MTLAIASQLGEVQLARRAARELGELEIARRIELAHRQSPDLLRHATSREARLRRAEQLLDGFQSDRALALARALTEEAPWWPEALDLERRACLALGKQAEARLLERRILFADPLFFERAGSP